MNAPQRLAIWRQADQALLELYAPQIYDKVVFQHIAEIFEAAMCYYKDFKSKERLFVLLGHEEKRRRNLFLVLSDIFDITDANFKNELLNHKVIFETLSFGLEVTPEERNKAGKFLTKLGNNMYASVYLHKQKTGRILNVR
jgi:hypothetical protein